MSSKVAKVAEYGGVDPYAGHWETRYSDKGFPFQVWCRDMPWIDPQMLATSVYLYPSEAAAEDGSEMGGSGFLLGVEIFEKGRKFAQQFIVTNKHVIDSGAMIVRVNTPTGHTSLPLDDANWIYHPSGDDIAVCPVELSSFPTTAKYLPYNMLLTKKIVEDHDIGPGDDIFVLGRFVNHAGKERNLPTLRFGNIAQMPFEPIRIDGFDQESFLVEARSISGFSGSPVFVFCPPQLPMGLNPEFVKMVKEGQFKRPMLSRKRANQMPLIYGPWLLGINYCYLRSENELIWSRETGKPVNENWYVKSNTGMMGVVPAWKLSEIIEGPMVQKIMKPLRENFKHAVELMDSGKVELTASRGGAPDNPNHKEDFTALLDAAARKPRSGGQTS